MRLLDRTRLLESPDHAIIKRPWDLDALELQCTWDGGNDGLRVDVLLSKPFGIDAVRLRFTGVTDLRLDGFRPLAGLRIIDATAFHPEIPAPICVVHYRWPGGDEPEPYFWANAVEICPSE